MKALRNSIVGAVVSVFALALLPVASASAASSSANTTINGVVNGAITIATSGTVNIPAVTPTAGGNASVASDTVTVTTNNSAGYTLTLSMSAASTSNALVSGANTLAAGTVATPSTWGYSLSSAALSDQPVGSVTGTFQAVPLAASAVQIKNTSVAATTGDATPVYYGLSANASQPSGTYTGTVTYTAVTN